MFCITFESQQQQPPSPVHNTWPQFRLSVRRHRRRSTREPPSSIRSREGRSSPCPSQIRCRGPLRCRLQLVPTSIRRRRCPPVVIHASRAAPVGVVSVHRVAAIRFVCAVSAYLRPAAGACKPIWQARALSSRLDPHEPRLSAALCSGVLLPTADRSSASAFSAVCLCSVLLSHSPL